MKLLTGNESEQEIMVTLQQNLKEVYAEVFHLRAIEQEDNPEICEIHIQAIETIRGDQYSTPVRKMIQTRMGDFGKITDKCLAMGLVEDIDHDN